MREEKFRDIFITTGHEISRDVVGIPFDNCGERGLANRWAENGALQPGRDRSKMTDIPKFEGRDREWRGYLNIPLESRRGIPFVPPRSRGRFRRRRIETTSIVIRLNAPLPITNPPDDILNKPDCVCLYIPPFFGQT